MSIRPRHRHPLRASGFTLTEMLVILILLAAFAIVASRLFFTTMHLTMDSSDAQSAASAIDATLASLRADAWAAKQIDVPDPYIVKLTTPDGAIITWTIGEGDMTRSEGKAEQHLQSPPGIAFASEPAAIVVTVTDPQSPSGKGEIRMASQSAVLAKLVQ